MSCPEKPGIAQFRTGYATNADFCELLERELKPLYLLAFLLTANHKEAKQCLVTMVDEALKEPRVFKEWVRSWIKRSLIKNAIDIVGPASGGISEKRDLWNSGQNKTDRDDEINAVTQLPPFERFVFVMSILERYSPWECSVLLGCSPKSACQARMQASRALPGQVALFPPVEERASSFGEVRAGVEIPMF
jgi:DNA-directed RNA polymerase specialized sigma24 family protein